MKDVTWMLHIPQKTNSHWLMNGVMAGVTGTPVEDIMKKGKLHAQRR